MSLCSPVFCWHASHRIWYKKKEKICKRFWLSPKLPFNIYICSFFPVFEKLTSHSIYHCILSSCRRICISFHPCSLGKKKDTFSLKVNFKKTLGIKSCLCMKLCFISQDSTCGLLDWISLSVYSMVQFASVENIFKLSHYVFISSGKRNSGMTNGLMRGKGWGGG